MSFNCGEVGTVECCGIVVVGDVTYNCFPSCQTNDAAKVKSLLFNVEEINVNNKDILVLGS